MKVIIIASVSSNGVIGFRNKLPWYIPEDLKHFKSTTFGHTILMGRKTYESIGKPLPGRINYVLSRSLSGTKTENIIFTDEISQAIMDAEKASCNKFFIIGGGNVFAQAFMYAQQMIITRIKANYKGDVYFPDFNEDEWTIEDIKEFNGFDIINYSRTKTKKLVF